MFQPLGKSVARPVIGEDASFLEHLRQRLGPAGWIHVLLQCFLVDQRETGVAAAAIILAYSNPEVNAIR
jgi:hypothetical protein